MKIRWSPTTKVTVVMVVALALPIAALLAQQVARLYYFKQTRPFHAIVNQELLQVIRSVEKQIIQEQYRLGREIAQTLEPAVSLDKDLLREKLHKDITTKSYVDVLVYYHPSTGALIFPRPAAEGSFEQGQREPDRARRAGVAHQRQLHEGQAASPFALGIVRRYFPAMKRDDGDLSAVC